MRAVELNGYTLEITGKEDGNARDERHRVYAKYCAGRQTHGNNIAEITGDDTGLLDVYCDGLLGVKEESFLGVRTGDCCPIALLGKNFFCVIHGSWKTLYEGILFSALTQLEANKEHLHELVVFFGPSIRQESYEVGKEFYGYFPNKFLHKQAGILTFDMIQFAISQLRYRGVLAKNIVVDPYCTYTNNDLYYSHRKGESERNFLGVSKTRSV